MNLYFSVWSKAEYETSPRPEPWRIYDFASGPDELCLEGAPDSVILPEEAATSWAAKRKWAESETTAHCVVEAPDGEVTRWEVGIERHYAFFAEQVEEQ